VDHGLRRYVWSTDLTTLSRWHARGLWALRFAYVLVRDLAQDRVSLRAPAWSTPRCCRWCPLLAVIVAVLKAIGIHRQLQRS